MTNMRWLRAASKPRRPGRWIAAVVAVGAVLVACSNGAATSPHATTSSSDGVPYPGWPGSGTVVGRGDFVPILVSAEVGVGHDRVLVTVQDRAGRTISSPDLSITLRFFDLGTSVERPASEAKATFRWLIPDSRGIYAAYADFDRAGDWGLEVTGTASGQPERTARVTFSVRQATGTPAIGAAAPRTVTPTASDAAGIATISTDPHPDPAFYTLSIRDAIDARKPLVVIFATPAFCESGTCGPALDLVKQVAGDYVGKVSFIHVEPYRLKSANGRIQPVLTASGHPQPVQAVIEWGLPTEPYVFVVDARGKVAAKFEGPAYPDELKAALDALLS
jgi:hypothetical protein